MEKYRINQRKHENMWVCPNCNSKIKDEDFGGEKEPICKCGTKGRYFNFLKICIN